MIRVVIAASFLAFTWSCVTALDEEQMARRISAESTVINTMKLTKVQTFDGVHKGVFSRDGTRLGLIDQSHVDVIETGSGRRASRIALPGATYLAAKFSPHGDLVATAYRAAEENGGQASTKVTLSDTTSGQEKITLPLIDHDWRRPVDDLSFSPDGRLLASNIGGIARLWEVDTGKEVRRFVPENGPPDQQAERAIISPDGKLLLAYFISATDGAYRIVHLWNLETGKRKTFETEVYLDWEFSADSKLLALTAITDKGRATERSVAEIWDPNAGNRVEVIEVPREWRGAYTVAFSPDSKLLAIGGYKNFGIFSIRTGELLAREAHHKVGFFQDSELPNEVSDIEFAPDGRMLLTGGNDNRVILWKVSK